jgi:RNA polymerase sigma factor (sigma-70 family)
MTDPSAAPETLEAHLRANRSRLLSFIRSRVADPDLAEDILQDSMLRALRAAPDTRSEERLTAWLYAVVRSAIAEAFRQAGREARRVEAYGRELDSEPDADTERELCECIGALIPSLKPEYEEIIRTLDLEQQDPRLVAERLGITPDNLKVRRHRARKQLRQRLEETCRTCATHGCLDCTCGIRKS